MELAWLCAPSSASLKGHTRFLLFFAVSLHAADASSAFAELGAAAEALSSRIDFILKLLESVTVYEASGGCGAAAGVELCGELLILCRTWRSPDDADSLPTAA
jgi:hypothetical protein